VTTPDFLVHFGLDSLNELPGLDELRAAGLLDLTPFMLPEQAGEKNAEQEARIEP
jgi:segregation and condensation protein B